MQTLAFDEPDHVGIACERDAVDDRALRPGPHRLAEDACLAVGTNREPGRVRRDRERDGRLMQPGERSPPPAATRGQGSDPDRGRVRPSTREAAVAALLSQRAWSLVLRAVS